MARGVRVRSALRSEVDFGNGRMRQRSSIRTRTYDPFMAANDDVMRSIDAKLSALLALVLDGYLRQTGVARPKERSVDKMLSDVGLSAATIAKLLGKSDRAVHLQLAGKRAKKTSKKTAA
jgi:hypothetical protein